MIKTILKNASLVPLLKNEVSENSAKVNIDENFYLGNGQLDTHNIVNLAIDEYYNSLGLGNTPPSIDNLLVIKRGNNRFSIYLIELKDVKKLGRICSENIKSKFSTTINDFMLSKFTNEFDKDNSKITDLNLWLVCNRFTFMNHDLSSEDYEKRIKNTLLEKLMLIPPFRYKGKIAVINIMANDVEIC